MEHSVKLFKKILVPIDFSVHSDLAVEVAADLSRHYLASVTLAHVYAPTATALPGGFMFLPEPAVDKLFADLQKGLDDKQREAEAAGALNVHTQLETGLPASGVCDLAQAGNFDLIVMGTHGRTGLSHALLGSVAERVARLAHCPVLTVRARETAK
jgi:universal stress protein A